jgi:thioredoxin-related protein/tetratricopeptide (TPR) repeat protein
MAKRLALFIPALVVLAVACQPGGGVWFKGDAAAAGAAARERDTLVMMEFYTDWCSWCRRLENDTFTDPGVIAVLKEIVPIRVDAEGAGEDLARQYGVDSYPTVVFVDGQGSEVDRILGYLPPAEFVEQTRRIRMGDTFIACLYRLSENPSDMDALIRSVDGLLERSDPEGAIARIKAFHGSGEGHNHDTCKQLMFQARAALHTRLYGRAAKVYRQGWNDTFMVPETDGTRNLHALAGVEPVDFDPDELARRLREARHLDAAELLSMVELDAVPTENLVPIGDFAFRNGHYDLAADIYETWFAAAGSDADPDDLNSAAWQLYLSGRSLNTGLSMARDAYDRDPSADIADTVARLLYMLGEVDEAIEYERRALATPIEVDVPFFREGLERMEAGQDLGDRPEFEIYPGNRVESVGNASRTVI